MPKSIFRTFVSRKSIILFILLFFIFAGNVHSLGSNDRSNSYLPPLGMEDGQYRPVRLVGVIKQDINQEKYFLILDGNIHIRIDRKIPLTEFDTPEFVGQIDRIISEHIVLRKIEIEGAHN